jgi:error-prone DNA polymerase
LGLRQVDGLRLDAATRVAAARGATPYASVEELKRRSGIGVAAIERLAGADAFRSMKLDRRAALWDSRALKSTPDLPLFAAADARDEGWETEVVRLPAMPLGEHVVADYQSVRLSLKAHPMHFLRNHYAQRGFVTADSLRGLSYGRRVSLAGLVLIRQRPGSAKGVCFITLEDETGVANLVIWPDAFASQRKVVMGARLMVIHGFVQHDEQQPGCRGQSGPANAVVHVIAQRLEDDTHMLRAISQEAMPSTLSAGDGGGSWKPPVGIHPRDVQCIPKSRDFR